MEELGTYVNLFRKFTEWEWYKDVPVKTLFLHCLIRANYRAQKYKGRTIERGSFVTSRKNLSLETGLTEQQVRTALGKLVDTKEITRKTTNKETVISVVNYDKYQPNRLSKDQSINQQDNQQATNEQPTNNQQITINQPQYNKDNKYNKEKRYAQIAQSTPVCDTQNSGVMLENVFDREYAFNEFWKAYPKKRDKKKSHIKFLSICKNEQVYQSIMDGLGKQVASADWLKNNGQYIPYPTTWLCARKGL